MQTTKRIAIVAAVAALLGAGSLVGCKNDENEANRRGVGSECTTAADCTEENQECLAFRGGYCGVQGCTVDADCPAGSACVTHTDNQNYCFLVCVDKVDCNRHRTVDNESNCASNTTFVEGAQGRKACIPPSSI